MKVSDRITADSYMTKSSSTKKLLSTIGKLLTPSDSAYGTFRGYRAREEYICRKTSPKSVSASQVLCCRLQNTAGHSHIRVSLGSSFLWEVFLESWRS